MATEVQRPSSFSIVVAVALLVAALVLVVPGATRGAETPRRGGVLLAVIGADPPSLDSHQESTFANIELVAPLYSTLLQLDPYHYPKIIGDLATEWKIAPDGLTYTFKLHQGVKFHDGSPLTAADVKASYDKIIFPPQGVRSIRKNAYTEVSAVEAPDVSTVVFKLKFPSASLLSNLASPWNVIYPKKYLDQDPNYFKTRVVGSGPFKFKGYTRGSTFEGERNPDYFVKDRPYLNGYKFYISPETSVRAAAIRSGRAYIEFRHLPAAEVDAIKKQLGDKVAVQETPMTGQWGVGINNSVKPFTDPRVRKALTLGIDRYTMGKVLYPLTGLKNVGALIRPDSEWGMAPAELEKLPGFGKDIEKSRAEAKRLLAEAGYPNGLKVVLKNRNVKLPYQDFAVFLIQEWRQIGVEAENRPLETAAWFNDGQNTGNFELIVQPTVEFMDDPDQFLGRYATGSTQNWGRFSDPQIDDLFSRQARTLDPVERKKLINQIEKIVLDNVYFMPGLWWTRNLVHWTKVKNYVAPPNHYTNQKLQDVWLSED
ncbi:MAG TPA: ABC transporter substrate-binding protein [Methylomirabilota bacterium]|jgi:peptide/nickel transport system substrate-binding protein|nr:ABC transporter substrate-binding protein [Methylomirabilota bacterium]